MPDPLFNLNIRTSVGKLRAIRFRLDAFEGNNGLEKSKR